jgi:predicted nuclease of restriction endonuclease-like (RecB) superfamily
MQNFEQLATIIGQLHTSLRGAAAASVNRMMTMRNWMIGMYIVEYEQNGEDRAEYGSVLLASLSSKLKKSGLQGMSAQNLRNFRQFYLSYQCLSIVITQYFAKLSEDSPICQKASGESLKKAIGQKPSDQLAMLPKEISQAPSDQFADNSLQIQQKPSAEFQPINNQCVSKLSPQPEQLIKHFSFSHFVELMRISEPLKRAFYEIEGINGCWSVPQLKRQIESLLFERTGLSTNKKGMVETAHSQNVPANIDDVFRDPYILEFTGLPERHEYSESDLESALIGHIQSFLIELGNGFCFEARQKRITLDNEHDRIDLVFYHRILRCHVLIDLKVRKFQHGDAGQMNFYLNYYRENEMAEGDNPPIGLILCTDRNETRVKYATTGMDNQLFVSKYLTALPSEEQIQKFLENDRGRTENVLREKSGVEYR